MSGLGLSGGSTVRTYPNCEASFEIAPSALVASNVPDHAAFPVTARALLALNGKVVMQPDKGREAKLHIHLDNEVNSKYEKSVSYSNSIVFS